MAYLVALFALAAALLFQVRLLNVRKLRERGVSALGALHCQRYAIFPAALLALVTFRPEYLRLISENHLVLAAIVLQMVFWIVVEYLHFFVLGSVNTLSFLNALNTAITIPVYVLVGIVLNNDVPNPLAVVALGTLVVALCVRPTPHERARKEVFQHGALFIAFFSISAILLDGVSNALYRFVLQNVQATLFVIGITAFTVMLVVNAFFLVRPLPAQERSIIKANWKLAYPLAPLWFVASIPEGYAFAAMPVYTFVAIGSLRFLIDAGSDIRNNRIRASARTALFAALVIAGVALSVLSLK